MKRDEFRGEKEVKWKRWRRYLVMKVMRYEHEGEGEMMG
jgi:hypothetical protein